MTDWLDRAACDGLDVALFFPEEGENPTTALEVCKACPVRHDCLDEAIRNNETHGVWGGLTPRQRQRIRWERIGVAPARGRPKWQRLQSLAVRARLIAGDARSRGDDPVQAVSTRMNLSLTEAADLLARPILER